MNTLSRREEDTLLKETKARALKECDDLVADFARCAEGRLVSVAWACRTKWTDVQTCMKQYTGPEQMDALRARYIELRREHAPSAVPQAKE
ncbi:hypothetical protein EXIGLDRAFT_612565 [Exidia glandulosa HHB12029]|uniref:COX assembly mitochondrial protein n=1 Tax=Exidia glandulosa HHB12029 TaxID=1314781 RepID=A0A165IRC1_EXIGL|nr:hypothetical protein EXIGLDRAFT_612565 [Exidia glandulosa HHB12029]